MTRRALAALLAFCIAPVHADLRLVTEDKPPFNFVDPSTGKMSGISVEILREAALRAKVSISRIDLLPMARSVQLALNQTDTCVFPVLRTPEREPHFRWIGPYTQNTWSFYARDDFKGHITSLSDALHFSIGSDLGSPKTAYLKSMGFNAMSLIATDALNAKKLSVGRFDLWLIGLYDGKIFADRFGITNIQPVFDIRQVDYYLACNLSVPASTAEAINAALDGMRKDGFSQRVESDSMKKFRPPARSNPSE